MNTRPSLKSLLAASALAATLIVAAPGSAVAQDKVYSASEVGTPASIKNKAAAASAIDRNYPSALQRVGGKVQLQFVVKADGKVDPASVQVVVASVAALGDAATRAIKLVDFTPATVNGQPVASIVTFPVTYAAR